MENVSDLRNNETGSKRRRICDNYEPVHFNNMKQFNTAIQGKVETDNLKLTENFKYFTDTPLDENLEKSSKLFKNERNIGKDSKKETVKMTNCVKESRNKASKSYETLNGKKDKSPNQEYKSIDCKNQLKLTKAGRNSISSTPQKGAAKTNDRKLSLDSGSLSFGSLKKSNCNFSPSNENKKKIKNQNLGGYQDQNVITCSTLKHNSPPSSCDEKPCSRPIRDDQFSDDQFTSEQDCEEEEYSSKLKMDLANNFEMNNSLEDLSSNSSEESNVSVKENVRMPSKKQNLKNNPDSKAATFSENIKKSRKMSNQNSYSEEYDENEEISEDSFSERREVFKRFAPNEKSKSSKGPKSNSKVAKLSPDLLNEKQQNLNLDSDEEESLDYSPIPSPIPSPIHSPTPAKSMRRSQRIVGKENRNSYTNDKAPTVKAKAQLARKLESSLSESEEIFDSPEEVKPKMKKSLNKIKSKNGKTTKESLKKKSTKSSRVTPQRSSLPFEELGSSWDRNVTPSRRFSLRLKKEPGSGTPGTNTSYLSLGSTPSSLRKRYTGSSTDSEKNTKIKSKSKNSKVKTPKKIAVKKIHLKDSDDESKPGVSTKNLRKTRKSQT